jgi:hypothetical protein
MVGLLLLAASLSVAVNAVRPCLEQYQRGLHILGIRGRTWNGGSVLVGGGELPAAQRTKAAPDHLFAFAR